MGLQHIRRLRKVAWIMSRKARFWILAAIAAVLIAASWVFFLHLWKDIYWSDERYSLIALDSPAQMSLSFYDEGYYSELVGPTVYSIGANEKYLVLKQHPASDCVGAFNRRITNFYVVERTASAELEDRRKRIHGPLTQAEFEKLAATLSLPGFDKTFRELE